MVAARVLTRPSTPRLSKYTDSRVSHWPGRIRTDSLIASPYRSLRAATVANRPAGAVTGISDRPYMAQAIATPTITRPSVTRPGAVNRPFAGGAAPVTGARK